MSLHLKAFYACASLIAGLSANLGAQQTKVANGLGLYQDAASQIRQGVTTKGEIASWFKQRGLNAPTWRWEDVQASAYTWQSGEGASRSTPEEWWACCVVFDSAGRVTSHAFFHESDVISLEKRVERWLPKPKPVPSNIRVHGEINDGGGNLAWKEGMTLGSALKLAGGLNRVARGVIIYSIGEDKPRRSFRVRDFTEDPSLLDYPLQAGDRVWAWTTI